MTRAAWVAPHRRHRVAAVGSRKAPDSLEADTFVALHVGGVARLQIRRHPRFIDLCEVLCEQSHSDAVTSARGMRSEEAQVVMRLISRVRFLEPLE